MPAVEPEAMGIPTADRAMTAAEACRMIRTATLEAVTPATTRPRTAAAREMTAMKRPR